MKAFIFLTLFFCANSYGSGPSQSNCSFVLKAKGLKKPVLKKIGSVAISSAQSKTMTFVPLQNSQILIRSSGYVYIAHVQPDGNLNLSEVVSFKGLESKIESIEVVDGAIWATKLATDPALESEPVPEEIQHLFDTQIVISKNLSQVAEPMALPLFKKTVDSPFGQFTDFAFLTRLQATTINSKKAVIANVGLGPAAWVTYDLGASWAPMVLENPGWETSGYYGNFRKVKNKIFFGGEHPLDFPYLKYGVINKAGVIEKLVQPKIPDLQNRRVQFIKESPFDSNIIFAGVEGGLIASYDGGDTWDYSYVDDIEGKERGERHYPYISSVVWPDPKQPNLVLAAGQPQFGLGTLIISYDNGKTWSDVSDTFIEDNEFLGMTSLNNGTILIGLRKHLPSTKEDGVHSTEANIFAIDVGQSL